MLLAAFLSGGCGERRLPVYFAEDSTEIGGRYEVVMAREIPGFRFLSQENTFLSNTDLAGSVYVADFFFTTCPGICKDMSSQLERVQERFKDHPKLKIVSFSVDPGKDSVPALKNYASLHRAIPGKWYFLTGTKDSIYNLAKHGYLMNALEDKEHPGEFIHDNHFVLVDGKGWIRGFYDGTDPKDVDRLIEDLPVLLKEYDQR